MSLSLDIAHSVDASTGPPRNRGFLRRPMILLMTLIVLVVVLVGSSSFPLSSVTLMTAAPFVPPPVSLDEDLLVGESRILARPLHSLNAEVHAKVPSRSLPFHPSIDPKPHQLDPPVASIPTLEDSAWAADFVIGARHARRMVSNLSALFLPFGGRSASGAGTGAPPLTDSQLLMGELYHVWRQTQFAMEVLGCAYHHHSSEEGTDRVMAQHAKVLGAALDRIGRGDTSGAVRWNGTAPGDVLSMLRAHPLLGDFRAMGSLYDAVAAHSTADEGGSGSFADDIVIDAMCVAQVAAYDAEAGGNGGDPMEALMGLGIAAKTGRSSSSSPMSPHRRRRRPHYPTWKGYDVVDSIVCVAPGTGQGIVGRRHSGDLKGDIKGPMRDHLSEGLAALAGPAAEGTPSRPVACIWAFFDDAFAANEFVVRALMRAPNAFIFAQSPTYSDYGWRVCEGEGSGANATTTTSHDGLPAPRLCLERRPAEFEGYARHPRLLAVPHADYRSYASHAEAEENYRAFVERFTTTGGDNSDDGKHDSPFNWELAPSWNSTLSATERFLEARHARSRLIQRRGSRVPQPANHSFLTLITAEEGGSPPPPVRLCYRSSATGYAPMFHAAHHVLMGTHRDTAILRQREANWWALGELRGFFHHRAVDDGSRALTMPSFAEVFVVMQQLLRHYHQSDRVRMVAALNNVDLGDNVGGGTVAKNTYLFQHFLSRRVSLAQEESTVDCTTFGCAAPLPPFFNASLSVRSLSSSVRIGGRLGHPDQRTYDALPPTAGLIAVPDGARGSISSSKVGGLEHHRLGPRPLPLTEPMSREDMYTIKDPFRGSSALGIDQQAHMADFMIDVDGNANAFNSFLQKLCLGKPVFKVTSSGHHAQWYYRHLVNGVHVYLVPHDAIVRTIGEWLSNQTVEQAAAVGRNGRLFCERYFGDRGQWEALGAAMAADPWSFAEEQRAVPMRIRP